MKIKELSIAIYAGDLALVLSVVRGVLKYI